MRAVLILVLISVFNCSHEQTDYKIKLSKRLEEIRSLDFFNNGVVVYDDSSDYGSTFPRWASTENYYKNDIVTFSGGLTYEAIADSKGRDPRISKNEWTLIRGPHPYLFLKDTALTADIRPLVKSDHPYIKVYAFAALVHRGDKDLFNVIIENLSDTTKITQYTSDHGSELYPANLMIQYKIGTLSQEQKDRLRKLIEDKYPYLTDSLKLLVKK